MQTAYLKDTPAFVNEQPENIERYKALIHASGIGAWEYFPDTESLWCNDVYFAMLGRDMNDYNFSGSNNLKEVWIDLLHPDDREASTNRFAEYLKNPEGTHESYYRMKHSNGSWVWIWSRGRLFHNESSGYGAIGTHVDITKHKKAEEVIQRERILLRTLIDNLPDTIYVKDIKGRKIIANRADVECIGCASEEEVLGKTDLDLFNNDIGLAANHQNPRKRRTRSHHSPAGHRARHNATQAIGCSVAKTQ